MTRRNIVEPDPTHTSWRKEPWRNDLVPTLCLLALRLGRNGTLCFRGTAHENERSEASQRRAKARWDRSGTQELLHGACRVQGRCQVQRDELSR